MPSPSLAGRVALATGASRGIGEAIARALDCAGARVALVGRNRRPLEALARSLRHDSKVIVADLEDPAAPAKVVAEASVLGPIEVLVNNAAIGVRTDTVSLDASTIDRLMAVNVRAPLLLAAGVIPAMTERGGGSIVNITSVSGLVGTPRRAAYAATKGALDAATRSLAIELGGSGIRVNAVAPGVVDTAMWEKNKAIPGVVESVEALTPLGRWSQPEDIAEVVVFLASDAARFITGETISVDGGMAKTMDLYGGAV